MTERILFVALPICSGRTYLEGKHEVEDGEQEEYDDGNGGGEEEALSEVRGFEGKERGRITSAFKRPRWEGYKTGRG